MTAIVRTYRVRLYPSRAGHKALDQQFRAQCTLYNAALQHRRDAYRMAGKSITRAQQSKELTLVRADDPEYAAVNRTIQIATLRRLDRAFQAFFKRVKNGETPGFPRFKPFRRWKTLVCDNNVQARSMVKIGEDGKGALRIKGLPVMPFKANRNLPPIGNLAELRVCRTARRLEAHLVFASDVDLPAAPNPPERPVGLNMGVHFQVGVSDGTLIPGRREDLRRTKRLQRRVSRAKKGSNGRRRKVRALSKERQRQADQRKGAAHELSARLVKDYDFIAVEDLSIKQMTRSGRGTVDNPGELVGLRAEWNRGVLDQAWGDLTAKLTYKAESAGTGFVLVDPAFTTQDCSRCSARVPKAIGARTHYCPSCGLNIVKDLNSARNVLRLGLVAQVGGGNLAAVQAVRLLTESIGTGLHMIPYAPG